MSGPKAEILERSGWSRDYYGRLEDKAWLVQKGRKERRGERERALEHVWRNCIVLLPCLEIFTSRSTLFS